MYLVFSTSLNPDSRSRILAQTAVAELEKRGQSCQLIDLVEMPLPACDANECYTDPNVIQVARAIQDADGILIASPIYNYDLASSAKNLVELTGQAWTQKVVGFLCAAGGNGSYMAPMGLANSLMLDFRSLILPQFCYATGEAFDENKIINSAVDSRISQLVDQLVRISTALGRT